MAARASAVARASAEVRSASARSSTRRLPQRRQRLERRRIQAHADGPHLRRRPLPPCGAATCAAASAAAAAAAATRGRAGSNVPQRCGARATVRAATHDASCYGEGSKVGLAYGRGSRVRTTPCRARAASRRRERRPKADYAYEYIARDPNSRRRHSHLTATVHIHVTAIIGFALKACTRMTAELEVGMEPIYLVHGVFEPSEARKLHEDDSSSDEECDSAYEDQR